MPNAWLLIAAVFCLLVIFAVSIDLGLRWIHARTQRRRQRMVEEWYRDGFGTQQEKRP